MAIGTGDASFDYGSADLDVPYRLSRTWEIGGTLSFVYFDGEEQLNGSDYQAGVLTLYARVTF